MKTTPTVVKLGRWYLSTMIEALVWKWAEWGPAVDIIARGKLVVRLRESSDRLTLTFCFGPHLLWRDIVKSYLPKGSRIRFAPRPAEKERVAS